MFYRQFLYPFSVGFQQTVWPLSLGTEKLAEIDFYFDMGDRNAWLYFSINFS